MAFLKVVIIVVFIIFLGITGLLFYLNSIFSSSKIASNNSHSENEFHLQKYTIIEDKKFESTLQIDGQETCNYKIRSDNKTVDLGSVTHKRTCGMTADPELVDDLIIVYTQPKVFIYDHNKNEITTLDPYLTAHFSEFAEKTNVNIFWDYEPKSFTVLNGIRKVEYDETYDKTTPTKIIFTESPGKVFDLDPDLN